MTRLDRRLVQVELTAQRRQRAAPRRRYDASALTPWEQYELSLLLDRVRSAVPDVVGDQTPLTPDEEARLSSLMGRMRVMTEGSR